MKKMRKLLVALVGVMLLFSLVACGSTNTNKGSAEAGNAASVPVTEPPSTAVSYDPEDIVETNINHYAISVADYEASIQWYKDVFGFTELDRSEIPGTGVKVAHLQAPGFVLELFGPGENGNPLPEYRKMPSDDFMTNGNLHMGLGLADAHKTKEQMEAKGVEIVFEAEVDGTYSFFIHDNTGNLIEMIDDSYMPWYENGKIDIDTSNISYDPNDPVEIHSLNHIATSVADFDESIEWYKDVFGFTELDRSEIPGTGVKVAHLQAPEFVLEIFGPGENGNPLPEYRKMPSDDFMTNGNLHMGLGLKDGRAAKEQVEAKGIDVVFVSEVDGTYGFFIQDPTGSIIELIDENNMPWDK